MNKFALLILSWPIKVIIALYLFASMPAHTKEYIDSYETRSGTRDIHETTFTGEPSLFEKIFGNSPDQYYFIFNSLIVVFIFYAFLLSNRTLKPTIIGGVKVDFVAVFGIVFVLFFNPLIPIVKFIPADYRYFVHYCSLIALFIWHVVQGSAMTTYWVQEYNKKVNNDNLS